MTELSRRQGGIAGFLFALSAALCWEMSGPVSLAEQPRPAQRQTPMREVTSQGYRVQLDLSHQVLGLSMPEDKQFSGSKKNQKEEALLVAVPTKLLGRDGFVSASLLAQKAKQFDDGLYAAVDLAAEEGVGSFPGKAVLLKNLVKALTESSEPVRPTETVVLAAAQLGKLDITIPATARQPVQRQIDLFLRDELRSKPISFYTWNKALSAIFQQDRLLQTDLAVLRDEPGIEKLVRLLHKDSEARKAYETYLEFVARLTNPFPPEYQDLRSLLTQLDRGEMRMPESKICFFPPSQAHETELIKKMFGGGPIPQGFNLADEMIKRIRAGNLKLEPTKQSGWYDYQTWALEPLVIPEKMPEARHLKLDSNYTRQLLQLFKAILALTRETHIKQLEIPYPTSMAPGPEVVIHLYPELTLEPLASHYLRRAKSYRFIRQELEKAFGSSGLERMHRQTATGPVKPNLAKELRDVEALFQDAHDQVCRQLGMTAQNAPARDKHEEQRATPFVEWQKHLERDPDVGQDARMMVPIFYDSKRRATKVWVFLGWAARPMDISFEKRPTAKVFTQAGKPVTGKGPRLEFESRRYSLIYPVTAEVYVTRILNREEMRQVCDRYKTQSAILAHLR